jgi:hypothetical protein
VNSKLELQYRYLPVLHFFCPIPVSFCMNVGKNFFLLNMGASTAAINKMLQIKGSRFFKKVDAACGKENKGIEMNQKLTMYIPVPVGKEIFCLEFGQNECKKNCLFA